MAKMYQVTKKNEILDVSKTIFVNIIKDEDKKIKQASIINILSPIKCEIIYDKYVTNNLEKCKKMEKDERYACETDLTEKDLIQDIKNILNSDIYKNKVIWSYTNNFANIKSVNSIKKEFNISEFNEIVEFLKYEPKEELNYSADLSDSVVVNLFCLAFMFLKKNFV
jgi:hypothetical protein